MSKPPTSVAAEECFAATRGLCHRCGRLTDAKIVFEGKRVLLVKWCREHGLSRTLVSSDRDYYLRSLCYLKPRTAPRQLAVAEQHGCPDSCGLCNRHQQHTCVPLLEITSACDLDCPICLVAGRVPPAMTVDEVRRVIDKLVEYEGRLNMLTLSGGEPTMHPQFLEVVDAVRRPQIGILSVSTNGVRLAGDDSLLGALVERQVVIALQFDGASAAVYDRLRGRANLAELKLRLIDKILTLGGRVSLTFTMARGVNEEELGRPLELLFSGEGVVSLMVQPLVQHGSDSGPVPAEHALDRMTIPEVIDRLAVASHGVLRADDFTPLPCSHPTCFALTYLLKTSAGLVSLPSVVDADTYLDVIKNQALFGTDMDSILKVRDALYSLWSSDGIVPNREAVLAAVKHILADLNRLPRQASAKELLALGADHVKSIFIHQFMDRASFDLSRAVKCCNHYPQRDGRLLPACVRNCCGAFRG